LRKEGAFLRTPKSGRVHRIRAAVKAARGETLTALALGGLALALLVASRASPLVVALVFWQASVYAAGPYMSWLKQRAELTPELEQWRRSEERRERYARFTAGLQEGTVVLGSGAAVVFVLVLVFGASNPGHPSNPLQIPKAAPPASSGGSGHGSGHGARSGHAGRSHGASNRSGSTTTTTTPGSAGSTTTTTTTSSPTTSTTTTTTTSPTTSTSTTTTTSPSTSVG
jgi:hypothetical protein